MQEMQETQVQSLGWEDPWSRKWLPAPVFLPEKSHGQRNLVGYSPWGHEELGHDWETKHIISTHNMGDAQKHDVRFNCLFFNRLCILYIWYYVAESDTTERLNWTDTCLYIHTCVLSCFSSVQFFATLWTVAARLLCPWDSPSKNTGMACYALLQRIFPIQGSNLCVSWIASRFFTSESLGTYYIHMIRFYLYEIARKEICRDWEQNRKFGNF